MVQDGAVARIGPEDPVLRAALAAAGRNLVVGRSVTVRPRGAVTLTLSTDLARTPQEVLDFCLTGEGFTSIMPDPLTLLEMSSETGQLGGTYAFRWWFKRVVPIRWVAFIDSLAPGREFSDFQLRGIFRYFHHTHTCVPTEAGTRYTDTVVFAGPLGRAVDERVLLPQLRATFRERHARMRASLDPR